MLFSGTGLTEHSFLSPWKLITQRKSNLELGIYLYVMSKRPRKIADNHCHLSQKFCQLDHRVTWFVLLRNASTFKGFYMPKSPLNTICCITGTGAYLHCYPMCIVAAPKLLKSSKQLGKKTKWNYYRSEGERNNDNMRLLQNWNNWFQKSFEKVRFCEQTKGRH